VVVADLALTAVQVEVAAPADDSPAEKRAWINRWVDAHRAANPIGRPAPAGIPVSPLLDNAPDGTWPVVLTLDPPKGKIDPLPVVEL
jgi:hypothetical protein